MEEQRVPHKILLHAVNLRVDVRNWRHFRQESSVRVMRSKGVEQLAENVWLISADDPGFVLDDLFALARRYRVLLRTLEFDLESEWLDHPPHE